MQHEEDRERIRKQDDEDRKRHDEEDRIATERGLATVEELAKARVERGTFPHSRTLPYIRSNRTELIVSYLNTQK